ncbi:MAG: glycosyltransferase, partial [Nitrospinota bacterium]
MPPDSQTVAVSVVVPVTERCDDLTELYRSHAGVLKRSGYSFEFLFVFDGGFTEEAKKLEPLVALGEPIQIITLSRSFGEATALMLGFKEAQGDFLLTLSAYFQVVPEGIAEIIA